MIPVSTPSREPDELEPGTTLVGGRFKISARLGQGGTASVYLAYGPDGHAHALKVLETGPRVGAVEQGRFAREMRLAPVLASLPGVLPPLEGTELSELPGHHAIVYAYVRGPTLARFLAANRLTVMNACRLIRNIADTLAHLHDLGVIHRDVKPANIIYAQDGTRPRLIEYGYAWSALYGEEFSEPAGVEHAGARAGTRRYMAPEQALGAPPSPAFDVYALGTTLHEALAGRIPWEGFDDAEIVRRKCDPQSPIPSIRTQRRDLPEELADLVDAALEREVTCRLASMSEFRDRLDAILAELGDPQTPERGHQTRHRIVAAKADDRDAPQATADHAPSTAMWSAQAVDAEDDLCVPQGHLIHRQVQRVPGYRLTPQEGVETTGVAANVAPPRTNPTDGEASPPTEASPRVLRLDASSFPLRDPAPPVRQPSSEAAPPAPAVDVHPGAQAVDPTPERLPIDPGPSVASPPVGDRMAPSPEPHGEITPAATATPASLRGHAHTEAPALATGTVTAPSSSRLLPVVHGLTERTPRSKRQRLSPVLVVSGVIALLGGAASAVTLAHRATTPAQASPSTPEPATRASAILPAPVQPRASAPDPRPDAPTPAPVPTPTPTPTSMDDEPRAPAPPPAPAARIPTRKVGPAPSRSQEEPTRAAAKTTRDRGPACEAVRTETQNAWVQRDWAGVLRLVRNQNCWTSKAERLRFEVVALEGLKLYDRCVELGAPSSDPEVQRTVSVCRAKSSSP